MTGSIIHRWFTGPIAIALFAVGFLTATGAPTLALSPPVGTVLQNTAIATFTGGNDYVFPQVASNTVSTRISGSPVLKISAIANPNPVAPGETLTYTITIVNTGNLPATAVMAKATLSDKLQFQSASHNGTSLPPSVNWSLGAIPVEGSLTLTLTTTVLPGTPGQTVLPFVVSTVAAEDTHDSASLETTVGTAANLVITKSASVTVTTAGGMIDYTISYMNVGNRPASHVIIRDELPSETALVVGTITGGGDHRQSHHYMAA